MISDKELREAARACEKAMLATMPEPEECGAAFSPGFERRMKKMICRVDHPVRYWMARLLPVLALAGIAAAAAVWMLAGRETEMEPVPEPPAPPVVEDPVIVEEPEARVVYRPTWLPEGWPQDREAFYDGEGMIVYVNEDDAEAVFLYGGDGEAAEDGLENGREVPVGEETGTLYLDQSKGAVNDLFWSRDGVSFWLSAPFGEEDLIRCAESVEAVRGD